MKKIIFCGGGSAGHVIPNVAIIEQLDGFDVAYIGTENGIEKSICETNKIRFISCSAVKFVRGKLLCNLALPFKLHKSVKEAGEILDREKPDLLFCKGGYACVPAAIAAGRRQIPVITHESDVSAGLANKFIAARCRKVLTTFPDTAKKFKNGVHTGSPMRQSLFGRDKAEARRFFGLDDRPTLIVFGGGSGSKIINENVRKIALNICRNYNLVHVCGNGNIVNSNIYGYKQLEFVNDMGLLYACADGAVARCGSNSANELMALKIPTVFIPLENKRSRGDQVKNAKYFHSLGLCRVLWERDLTPASLLAEIDALFKDKNLKTALDASSVKCGNENIKKEVLRTIQQQS